MNILLVDDERAIVETLVPLLESHGYEVHSAPDAAKGLERISGATYDLVLLDLGLPDIDGIEIIGQVRALADSSIIVLSARHQESDKVRALDEGADDYVNKPFGIAELLARVRAAERRRGERQKSAPSCFISEKLTVNFSTREVSLMGQDIKLSPKEFLLLEALCRSPGQVLTRRRLLVAGWNDPNADTQYLRSYMALLRQKLEYDPAEPDLILTEPGVGYRLCVEPIP